MCPTNLSLYTDLIAKRSHTHEHTHTHTHTHGETAALGEIYSQRIYDSTCTQAGETCSINLTFFVCFIFYNIVKSSQRNSCLHLKVKQNQAKTHTVVNISGH